MITTMIRVMIGRRLNAAGATFVAELGDRLFVRLVAGRVGIRSGLRLGAGRLGIRHVDD